MEMFCTDGTKKQCGHEKKNKKNRHASLCDHKKGLMKKKHCHVTTPQLHVSLNLI